MFKKVKPIQQKLVFLLSAAILILCTFFLPVSYGKTSRQTSFNTDLRQPSVDLKFDTSSDSQNTHADSHKDFDVESWEKIKSSALHSGIFSRFNANSAVLYAQNGEPSAQLNCCPSTPDMWCDSKPSSTPCTSNKESASGDPDKDKDDT